MIRHTTDIKEDASLDARATDAKLRTVVRRFEAHIRQAREINPDGRDLLADLLDQQLRTHKSIRTLIKTLDDSDSLLGDALSLLREQIERVFIVCLIAQDPPRWTAHYLKDEWAKMFKLFCIESMETSELPRFSEHNSIIGPELMTKMRIALEISEGSEEWARFTALNPGATVPEHLAPHALERFPTPGTKVIKKISDANLKAALTRWHIEYERACSFSHSLATKIFLARSSSTNLLSVEVKYKLAHRHAELALFESYISAAFICAELYLLSPSAVEALVPLVDFYEELSNNSLLGKWLFTNRAKHILPGLSLGGNT